MSEPWVITRFQTWLTLNWWMLQVDTSWFCDLDMHYSLFPPVKRLIRKWQRGILTDCGYSWYLRYAYLYHQNEGGYPKTHTFMAFRWDPGTTIWYFFEEPAHWPEKRVRSPIFMTTIPSCPVISTQVTMESTDPPPGPPGDDEPEITEVVTYVQL